MTVTASAYFTGSFTSPLGSCFRASGGRTQRSCSFGIVQMPIKEVLLPYFCRIKGNTDYLFVVEEGWFKKKVSHQKTLSITYTQYIFFFVV